MNARFRFRPWLYAALLAVFLLAPSPARAASGSSATGSSATGASACFANIVYDAFTNRSRVVQISVVFVLAGYWFLRSSR